MERPIILKAHEVRGILDGEIVRLWHTGMTHMEIASSLKCGVHAVRTCLTKNNLRRPKAPRRETMAGPKNPAWKGQRRPKGGYQVESVSGQTIYGHRRVMERHLGRPLRRDEIVHHKDGNKQNNDISNLEVMSQAEHAKHHAPEMHKARYGR